MRICKGCGKSVNEEDFATSRNRCKECNAAYLREYYRKNRQRLSKYKHEYHTSKRGQEVLQLSKQRHHLKVMARNKVKAALKAGRLVKPEQCSACNRKRRLDGHHLDYSKPYVVLWLCYECHAELHRNI